MIYVAVDFSLNSPGICIHDDSKDSYHFVSYIKRGQGTKKDQKKQEDISLLKDTTLIYQPDWDKAITIQVLKYLKLEDIQEPLKTLLILY